MLHTRCGNRRVVSEEPLSRRAGRKANCSLHHSFHARRLRGFCTSIRLVNAIRDNPPVKGGELLVLLMMALYASDDGRNVYPSIGTLAKQTNQSRRAVEKQVARLILQGVIQPFHQEFHKPTIYHILIPKLTHIPAYVPKVPAHVRMPTGPRPDDSLVNPSLIQERVEKVHLQTPQGTEAMRQIAELLKIKIAYRGKP